MKAKNMAVLSALLIACAGSAQARPYCEGGGGYWATETRNVQVCDTVTENYTITQRHCGYSGHIYLGHLWNEPDFFLPYATYVSKSFVLDESSSCPNSQYETQSGTYWYTRPDGTRSVDWYTYSGSIGLTSDQLNTTEHTREVKTNCRTETKTVRVWRCGFEP